MSTSATVNTSNSNAVPFIILEWQLSSYFDLQLKTNIPIDMEKT